MSTPDVQRLLRGRLEKYSGENPNKYVIIPFMHSTAFSDKGRNCTCGGGGRYADSAVDAPSESASTYMA